MARLLLRNLHRPERLSRAWLAMQRRRAVGSSRALPLRTRRELVGRILQVEPVERLRGQQRFSGLEELSAQISCDAQQARERLQDNAG